MLTGFRDKTILITGGVGTIGVELVKQLLKFNPKVIRVLDQNETALFFMGEEYKNEERIRCFLGNVRDKKRLKRAIEGVDIVFHLAALKHVIICEYNPFEAVQTNLMGIENLIDVAIDEEVDTLIFTSSDKAANPTNVMGSSKLMGERLITSANDIKGNRKTVFATVRFGNVAGSNGSVFHIFKRQIAKGGPVTITDNNMTRFIMSVEEAARLVIKACTMALGGEVFVTKMSALSIHDLAEVMINELAPKYGYKPEKIERTEVGIKPGEKLYEELMTEDEVTRAWELEGMYVIMPVIKPMIKGFEYSYAGVKGTPEKAYNSSTEKLMSRDEIRQFLYDNGLI
jgi:FlaA1/EpsC-like NDP-sugar epimerase